MTKLLLLEPYHSALLAEAVDEGLAQVTPGFDVSESPAIKVGRQLDLQQKVRSLSLLFDSLSIVHYEDSGDARELENRGYPSLSLLRLRDTGIVEFTSPPADKQRLAALSGVRTFEDWWQKDKDLLSAWEPVIISQMMARGKLPDVSLYHVLRAMRLGEDVEAAIRSVPIAYQGVAADIANDRPNLPYDIVALTAVRLTIT
jgi:hypothetical protein